MWISTLEYLHTHTCVCVGVMHVCTYRTGIYHMCTLIYIYTFSLFIVRALSLFFSLTHSLSHTYTHLTHTGVGKPTGAQGLGREVDTYNTYVHSYTFTYTLSLSSSLPPFFPSSLSRLSLSHIHTPDTHRCRTSDTGWQRLVGCLALQVIFRKRATNYRALWWKMTYKDKACYDPAPPCSRSRPATRSSHVYHMCALIYISVHPYTHSPSLPPSLPSSLPPSFPPSLGFPSHTHTPNTHRCQTSGSRSRAGTKSSRRNSKNASSSFLP